MVMARPRSGLPGELLGEAAHVAELGPDRAPRSASRSHSAAEQRLQPGWALGDRQSTGIEIRARPGEVVAPQAPPWSPRRWSGSDRGLEVTGRSWSRSSAVRQLRALRQPRWWNKVAWMRCCQPVRSPTRARRSRTVGARVGDVPSGIHDSGRVPARSSSAQVVGVGAVSLGRAAWGPRSARVSAGSARCAPNPARSSSSATNRQPVVASNARVGLCWPANRASQTSQPRQGGRAELPAAGLAAASVQVVVGDLPPVDVEAAYDGHRDLLGSCALRSDAASGCRTERRGCRSHAIYGGQLRVGGGRRL